VHRACDKQTRDVQVNHTALTARTSTS